MSDFYPSFESALKTVIKAVWSDVADKNIFTLHQSNQSKLIDSMLGRLKDSTNATILSPIVIISIGDLTFDMDHGLCNKLYRAPVQIAKIIKSAGGSTSTQITNHADLYALKEYIFSNTNSWFNEEEPAEVNSDGSNPLNEAIAVQGLQWHAGVISWFPGLLVGDQAGQ